LSEKASIFYGFDDYKQTIFVRYATSDRRNRIIKSFYHKLASRRLCHFQYCALSIICSNLVICDKNAISP